MLSFSFILVSFDSCLSKWPLESWRQFCARRCLPIVTIDISIIVFPTWHSHFPFSSIDSISTVSNRLYVFHRPRCRHYSRQCIITPLIITANYYYYYHSLRYPETMDTLVVNSSKRKNQQQKFTFLHKLLQSKQRNNKLNSKDIFQIVFSDILEVVYYFN